MGVLDQRVRLVWDAWVYAAEVRRGALIEPGHLTWRPLGAVLASVFETNTTNSDSLWTLQFLSLFVSVLSVGVMFWFARQYFSTSIACLIAALFSVSNGFWTYAFSGSSYGLSVLFSVLAWASVVRLVTRDDRGGHLLWIFLVGSLSAMSAATWGAQVICAPVIWLAIMLYDRSPALSVARMVSTLAFSAGFVLFLAVPLVVLYANANTIGLHRYVAPHPDALTF